MDAFRYTTEKTYSSYIRKWCKFCLKKKIKILCPSLPEVCAFLRDLEKSGLGHSAMNVARSALSAILPCVEGKPVGQHRNVCWVTKGSHERHPPGPRYPSFWDVKLVLSLFKRWGSNDTLSFKFLSMKLAMLLLLVTSQRGQTIVALDIDHMLEDGDKIIFNMTKLLKSNRCGDRLSTVMLKRYAPDSRLCIIQTLRDYLERAEEVRPHYESQLLISFIFPNEGISRNTLARWALNVMDFAGVDTDRWRLHSTRGASTSKAKSLGVSVNAIMRQAGWRSSTSFAIYYDKEIEVDTTEVAQAILHDN